jgi:Ca-activated chloride channel family protein
VSFGWPIALVGLLAIPLLVALHFWSESRRTASQAAFGNPDLLPNVVDRAPGRLRYLPLAVLLLALATMVVGVARPHATVSVPREEATVILAVDVSRSMKAEDVEPTRLEAARATAKAFLAEVPERFRVGVVSFATRAAVGVPPTEDRSLVEAALDALRPGEGTAIGDAVALSVQLGQRERTSDGAVPPRAVLLISDGARDGGRIAPAAAAEQARTYRIPIHTVLLGTPDGVVEERLTGGYRQIIRVPPSPETLQAIAETSGGEFFEAASTEELSKVYEDLGSQLGERKESREITDLFAAVATALLLTGGLMSVFLFRRVP